MYQYFAPVSGKVYQTTVYDEVVSDRKSVICSRYSIFQHQ